MTATEHARASQVPDPFQGLVHTAEHATSARPSDLHRGPEDARNWASTPSSARITNYFLGGRHNYPADRQVARKVAAEAPWFEAAVLINRIHGHLTVAALAMEYGITQFLDLGSGLLPTGTCDELHEPVCASMPGATFVHVDADTTMARHTRTCLTASPRSHPFVHADFRNILSVLRAPAVQSLDPGKPVGVLAHGDLARRSLAEARFILNQVRAWAPPGSAISMTHVTADFRTHEATAAARHLSDAGLPFHPRTRTEIAELLAPWSLREPGVVPMSRYHQGNPHAHLPDHASGAYAAIALHSPSRPRTTKTQTGRLCGPEYRSTETTLQRGPSDPQAARPAVDDRATKPEPEGRGAAQRPG
ncbi:SAM-dependent methyltransferase [Streptomyces sp. NPDC051644]|uniref:SAM-dependent methyltransferase n=1 Tax=Streptomyces sp. NPDC051644 TaxID=3365666 RepID=UPI0037A32CE1